MTSPLSRYGSSPLTVCGESGGKVDLGDWLRTAGTVLDRLGSDDNVLVGCSVGGWVSLWLASQEQFAHKISAVVVVSPAVNFLKQVKITHGESSSPLPLLPGCLPPNRWV